MNTGPGHGRFFTATPRNQHVLVKGMVCKSFPGRSWYGHGLYLQREGANREGEIGRGFDGQQNTVDLKTTLAQWQRDGDPHVFKIVLSPEHPEQLDLKVFTRRVVEAMERDLGQRLQWAGIDHHNTGHAHVHLLVRGVAEGHVLTMARSYLHGGIKQRAQEQATVLLGLRSRDELDQAREHALERKEWSMIDRSIKEKIDWARVGQQGLRVHAADLTPFEQRRMGHHADHQLAHRDGDTWVLAVQWEEQLMNERGNEPRSHGRTGREEIESPVQQPSHDHQRKEQEREADEHHQRAVIVDELEQDVGWGR